MMLSLVSVTLLQCKSNHSHARVTYDSLVQARMGNEFQERFNNSRTHALIHAADTGKYAGDYRYMVVKLDNNEVVLHGKFNQGGYVRWISDSMIELMSIPDDVRAIPDSSLYKEQIILEDQTR